MAKLKKQTVDNASPKPAEPTTELAPLNVSLPSCFGVPDNLPALPEITGPEVPYLTIAVQKASKWNDIRDAFPMVQEGDMFLVTPDDGLIRANDALMTFVDSTIYYGVVNPSDYTLIKASMEDPDQPDYRPIINALALVSVKVEGKSRMFAANTRWIGKARTGGPLQLIKSQHKAYDDAAWVKASRDAVQMQVRASIVATTAKANAQHLRVWGQITVSKKPTAAGHQAFVTFCRPSDLSPELMKSFGDWWVNGGMEEFALAKEAYEVDIDKVKAKLSA